MAGKWWIRTVLVVAAAASSPRARAADPDTRPSTQPANPADYVSALSRTLAEGTPAARYEAAQRLLTIDRPDARAAITRALAARADARARQAAARAAAEAPNPDPAWVTPLVNLLDQQNADNAPYVALALARFDEDPRAFDALIRVAISRQPGQLHAINALGRVVQKRAAAALLGLTNDPRQPVAVHEAATEALGRISPRISRTDSTAAARRRWWDERNALSDRDWRTRVVAEQHGSAQLTEARSADHIANLRKALYQLLYEKYEQQPSQPSNRKSDYLRDLLNDPDPDVRAVGARIVPVALTSAQVLKQEVWDRLVDLLGDASPDVRLSAAAALENLRDEKVFKGVVLQLPVENDLLVKKALVQILGHMEGRQALAAVPVLKGLLQDPSEPVAGAAADALTSLAPTLNPQARQEIFDAARQTLVDRTGPPGQPLPDSSIDLRASLVLAMGASATWNNPEMFLMFHQLIDEPASAVRQAAARALAVPPPNGRPAGPILSERLNLNAEPDPDVRAQAALSLGSMASMEWAPRLMESMRPGVEPSPAVREAAWQSLQRLLPSGDHDELSQLARAFKDRHEPQRQLVVQNVIANKTSSNQPLSKAAEFQTAGDISFNDLKRPADAVRSYREAMRYYRQVGNTRTPLTLIESLLRAYLASDQIAPAIEDSRTQISLDPKTKLQVGQILASVAEAWSPPQSKNPAEWEKARELIRQALTLDLADSEKTRLEEDLNKRLPPPPATRPSTTPAEPTRPTNQSI